MCSYVGRVVRNRYGDGRGMIWLDNVRCQGVEAHLGDCSHIGWGEHNCLHSEDVAVRCGANSSTAGTTIDSRSKSTPSASSSARSTTPSAVPSTPATPTNGIVIYVVYYNVAR